MNKVPCEVIHDLLPLYLDDAVSVQSRTLTENHLAECADCRAALSEMRVAVFVPRAGEPSVREALEGVRRALKRTKIRVIALTVIAMLFVGGLVVANYKYIVMAWTVRVPPEIVVIADVCYLPDGTIFFREYARDGSYMSGRYTQYVDGVCYMDFEREKLNPVKQTWGSSWEWLNTKLQDGKFMYSVFDEWDELLGIRVGTPEDYVSIWEKGMEIPPADPQVEKEYWDWMNMPTG